MFDLHVKSTRHSIYIMMVSGYTVILQAQQAEYLWRFSVWYLNDSETGHLLFPVYKSTCLQPSNSRGLTQNPLKSWGLDLRYRQQGEGHEKCMWGRCEALQAEITLKLLNNSVNEIIWFSYISCVFTVFCLMNAGSRYEIGYTAPLNIHYHTNGVCSS
jgi:hypothetical protein